MERSPLSQSSSQPADPDGGDGVLAGTRILTLDGELPVEFLEAGDRIVTRNGAARLISVSSFLRRAAPVVRVAASTIGHCRPTTDLCLAPGQRILIRDWRAVHLFGASAAAVPAARLADGDHIRHQIVDLARMFILHFANAEVIYAEGLELACCSGIAAVQPA